MNHHSTILHIFPRRHILDLNLSCFVETFDIAKKPDVALGTYCHGLQLELEIVKNEHRQPHLIPEIRSFCRELDRIWSYAAFAVNSVRLFF